MKGYALWRYRVGLLPEFFRDLWEAVRRPQAVIERLEKEVAELEAKVASGKPPEK